VSGSVQPGAVLFPSGGLEGFATGFVEVDQPLADLVPAWLLPDGNAVGAWLQVLEN